MGSLNSTPQLVNAAYQRFIRSLLARGLSEQTVFVLVSVALHFATCFSYSTFTHLCDKNDWFKEYKIQPGAPPTSPELLRKTVLVVLFNQFVLQIPGLFSFFALLRKANVKLTDAVPPLWKLAVQVAFFMLVEDTTFYWSHRLLHHKLLYKHIHKLHHQYKAPTGIAVEYAHPIEFIVSNSLTFSLGPLLVRPHPLVFWTWFFIRVGEGVDGHSGYEFPFSPFGFFPMRPSAAHHDLHHQKFEGNYGSLFMFWDKIMGTERDPKKLDPAPARKTVEYDGD